VDAQREADEAQIKQQVARIAEGIRAKDLEGLRPIYAPDVVSFDVEPPLQPVGVEAKLKNWANLFPVFRDADYEVRGLTLAVGDDVAFGHCCGRLHGTLMNGTATKGIWVRSRSASGSSTALGRSCATWLRCRSMCSAAEEWPTWNPDRSGQHVRTHPSKRSWPGPWTDGPDQFVEQGSPAAPRLRRARPAPPRARHPACARASAPGTAAESSMSTTRALFGRHPHIRPGAGE